MSVASCDWNGSVGSPYVVIHNAENVPRGWSFSRTFQDLDQIPGVENVTWKIQGLFRICSNPVHDTLCTKFINKKLSWEIHGTKTLQHDLVATYKYHTCLHQKVEVQSKDSHTIHRTVHIKISRSWTSLNAVGSIPKNKWLEPARTEHNQSRNSTIID